MANSQGTSTESSTDTTPPTDDTNPDTTPPAEDTTGDSDTDDGATDQDSDADDSDDTEDMFPRSYVERLRRENQGYREQASRATEYAQRLHTELVRATSRLADPEDLPFDEAHLQDSDALSGAIDALLKRKPHLASRRPTGDIGQGASGNGAPVDLAGLLRARA